MNTPERPRRKHSLARLGGLLILGGIIVLCGAAQTGRFYEDLGRIGRFSENPGGEGGNALWASGLGWVLVFGGAGLIGLGLARKPGGSD